jgi:hypothetical protein
MSHTLLATPSPFPLIDTKPFPTLPLCFPPANSRFSITVGPLAVSHPPADVDTDPWHPHSALLLHCMLYPVRDAFAFETPSRPRIALDLPLTLPQTPIFGIVGTLAPSTSQPRPRTPRTVPAPGLRWTVTSASARIRIASTY